MTPLPVIADTFRIALKWSQNNAVNVMHIHDAARTPPQLATLIDSKVTAAMWGPLYTGNRVAQLDITPLSSTGGTFSFVPAAVAKWAGGNTGDTIPSSAAVMSFKTLFRGPANRGRMYLGPITEAIVSNGIINPANVTALVAAWATFGADLVGSDAQHVVASYKHSTALTVTGWSCRPACGTQRRRQDRLA